MAEVVAPVKRAAGVVGRRSWFNGLFVLPFFLTFLVLMILPLCVGLWLSFQDYDMLGGYAGSVGWENFIRLWEDKI